MYCNSTFEAMLGLETGAGGGAVERSDSAGAELLVRPPNKFTCMHLLLGLLVLATFPA